MTAQVLDFYVGANVKQRSVTTSILRIVFPKEAPHVSNAPVC